jgi:hypothetical protein
MYVTTVEGTENMINQGLYVHLLQKMAQIHHEWFLLIVWFLLVVCTVSCQKDLAHFVEV